MRKNKFLTFLFALIPGGGHMYLGYMKRGVEYMAMFAASAYLASVMMGFSRGIGLEIIGVIFLIVLPIIWLYQMFESMHTVSQMKKLEIEYPEDDGFFIPGISNVTNLDALKIFKKRSVIKAIAITIICLGIYVLFSNISSALNGRFYINGDVYYINELYTQIFNMIVNYVPSAVISLILIFGGIKLLIGNKNNKNNKNNDNKNDGEE